MLIVDGTLAPTRDHTTAAQSENYRYSTAEFQEGRHVVPHAAGYVGAVRLEETQYQELDDEGRVKRLTLMMRPLAAATRFVRELGPRVARRQGRRGTAGVLMTAGAFLDAVVAGRDRVFLPMARPDRPAPFESNVTHLRHRSVSAWALSAVARGKADNCSWRGRATGRWSQGVQPVQAPCGDRC